MIHKKTQKKKRSPVKGFLSDGPLSTRLHQVVSELKALPDRKEVTFHIRLPAVIGQGLKEAVKTSEEQTVSGLVRAVLADYLVSLWQEATTLSDGRKNLYTAKLHGKEIASLKNR